MWFLAASNLMWTTMELIMSTTFCTPATIQVRSRGSGLIATVKTWWMSYLTRRIERAAIIQLHGMSERELQDIGLTRSQIERAVRGELDDSRQGRGCDGERRTLQSRAGDHYPTNGLGLQRITLRYTCEIRSEAEFIAEIFEMILPEEMPSVAEHIGDWRPRTILHVRAAAMNTHESRSNSVSDRLGHCCTELCGH